MPVEAFLSREPVGKTPLPPLRTLLQARSRLDLHASSEHIYAQLLILESVCTAGEHLVSLIAIVISTKRMSQGKLAY